MKEIQQKYKGDQPEAERGDDEVLQGAQHQPVGSCLPLLAQLPVFIALYFVLQRLLALTCRHWRPHVAVLGDRPEHRRRTATLRTGSGYVLIVIYVGSQLASTLLHVGRRRTRRSGCC